MVCRFFNAHPKGYSTSSQDEDGKEMGTSTIGRYLDRCAGDIKNVRRVGVKMNSTRNIEKRKSGVEYIFLIFKICRNL